MESMSRAVSLGPLALFMARSVLYVLLSFSISLLTSANDNDSAGMCFPDGQPVSYVCTYEYSIVGTTLSVIWISESPSVLDCPNPDNSIENNQIFLAYPGDCSSARGACSIFSASQIVSLNCEIGQPVNLTSTLTFIANYTLHNGATIMCKSFTNGGPVYGGFLIEIGVEPPPPATANLTFPRPDVCQYDWEESEIPVIGGIRGYNLTYIGNNCGTCAPVGLVSNTTFRSTCSGFEVNGQNCTFEVKTVTDDCGFYSVPAQVHSNLDNTNPTDVVVTVLCSESADSPNILVEWDYFIPAVDNSTVLPGVLGFRVIILDGSNNRYPLEFLQDSSQRLYEFNATLLETAGFVGESRFAVVEVETQVSNQSSNSSSMFSVQSTMTDSSPTLTPDQCISIIINRHCNESAESFQAQLQWTEGECGGGGQNNVSNSQTLSIDYTTCIFVEVGTLCYSAQVQYNGVVVGRTNAQQLVLQACNTTVLQMPANLVYNSSMGPVSPNEEVPHNSVLDALCVAGGCSLIGSNSQTRCVNGTFEPPIDSSCDCPNPNTAEERNIIIGAVFGFFLIGFIATIVIIILYIIAYKTDCCKKTSYYPEQREQKQKQKEGDSSNTDAQKEGEHEMDPI